MTRWLIGLAFAIFLVALTGLVGVALAATSDADVQVYHAAQLQTAYPTPSPTETSVGAYPAQTSATLTPTAPAGSLLQQPSPTVQQIGGATATPSTATPSFTRTPTSIVSITPTPTRTIVGIATVTPTPIRVIGLPVPGPGDRLPGQDNLPTTGGDLLGMFNGLLLMGGLGSVFLVLGRILRRR